MELMRVIDILNPHNLEAFQEINDMLESGTKRLLLQGRLEVAKLILWAH